MSAHMLQREDGSCSGEKPAETRERRDQNARWQCHVERVANSTNHPDFILVSIAKAYLCLFLSPLLCAEPAGMTEHAYPMSIH